MMSEEQRRILKAMRGKTVSHTTNHKYIYIDGLRVPPSALSGLIRDGLVSREIRISYFLTPLGEEATHDR